MKIVSAFFIALGLLTRFPVPKRYYPCFSDDTIRSLSVVYYPLIGCVIGTLVGALSLVHAYIDHGYVLAAFILVLWVGITGGLHLDGLADSCDAGFASHKDPKRTLDVMKDPYIGSIGVIAIVLVLLVKFSLLSAIVSEHTNFFMYLIPPVVARVLAQYFMVLTPYVREKGIAANLQLKLYFALILSLSFLILVITWFLLGKYGFIFLLLISVGWFLYWQRYWLSKIGGYTGDCVGALIEVAEVLGLLAIYISVSF